MSSRNQESNANEMEVYVKICTHETDELAQLICEANKEGEEGMIAWNDTITRLSTDTETLAEMIEKEEVIIAETSDGTLMGCVRLQSSKDLKTGDI